MEALETILDLFTDLQADETLDLSAYATRFVEVGEASDELTQSINDGKANTEANQKLIDELKGENWDLSKKITTKETLDEDKAEPVETETETETDETPYETNDEAIDDLFKKEKDDE